MTKKSVKTPEQRAQEKDAKERAEKIRQALELALGKHPFFQGVNPRYLKAMSRYANRMAFNRGDFLFHECEAAVQFHLICGGRISVGTFSEIHGPITIQTLGPGEVLGWSCIIPPHHWRFDAKATEPAEVISLDGELLRAQCEKNRVFGYEILKRLSYITAQRLELTRLHLVSAYGAAPAGRG